MLFAAIKCRNNRLSCSLRSFQRLIGVYFVCIQRRYYSLLNANELWRTTSLIYVDNGQYYTLSRWASDQGSYTKPHATGVPNSLAGVIISPMSTDGLTVLVTG